MMLARLFYGMASRGQLPAVLARVHPRAHTPIPATILAGAIVLAVTLLVPFERLLSLCNAITLIVFTLVDLALWRLRMLGPTPEGRFRAPIWVPAAAAACAFALVASEIAF
jgi:basic amino acid/polyamine antiporter, APA family